jgi:hypothetical protein
VLRKSILILGVVIILAMGVYPPWTETFARPGRPALYRNESGWLFDPPFPSEYEYGVWEVRIDFGKLGLEWLLVCIAFGVILWISKPGTNI